MSLLEVHGLNVRFGRHRTHVLHDVGFTIGDGQRLGLVGESGSGKTVTASALIGLLPDNAAVTGSVVFEGRELVGLPDHDFAKLRGSGIAMVFQEPMTALDPTMTVGRFTGEVAALHRGYAARRTRGTVADPAIPEPIGEDVATRGSYGGGTDPVPAPLGESAGPRRTRDRVIAMFAHVGLTDPERIATSYPHQLSGGQRQRVAMAMALMNGPRLVICDEPTTALDVTVQARVLDALDATLTATNAACLFISHDLAVVARICTDIAVMLDGRIVEAGPVAAILASPSHLYTRGLLATARIDRVHPGERLPVVEDFFRRDVVGHEEAEA